MASRSPEGHQQTPNGFPSNDLKAIDPNPSHGNKGSNSADIDRGLVGDGDDDEDGGDKRSGVISSDMSIVEKEKQKKKNRKRSKKKKAKPASTATSSQSTPPRVPISALFPGDYPTGQFVPYENTSRVTDEEARYTSRLWDDGFLHDYRQAAEIHRQVRQYVQQHVIKPGVNLLTIAEEIDDGVRALCGHQGLETGDGLKAGLAFPTGLSLNNIAAHWTPNPGGKDVVLEKHDVLKVDFGVHVNGRIVDSAFTVAFEPQHDNLLAAVKDATNTGIKYAGVDARIKDLSAAIQETMESYEVEKDGKVLPVRAVRTLTGHDILRYQIHGNKQIPFIKNNSRDKMEEGEVFAIETFGSTGKGYPQDDVGVYGYGRQKNASAANIQMASAKALLKTIDANFGTLVFCRRYLERLGVSKYHLQIKHLVDNGIIESYAPLVDVKGSQVAQFEHTILLHSGGKEVISRGDDY